ncbi:MAG: 3-methyl-2-oxobutanoate hydroxymethyltransferase [bacterium]
MAVTIKTINKYYNEGRKITALTAYDYSAAKVLDEQGIDIILVGDSLAMVALGHPSTHYITMEEMLHHSKAVKRGVNSSFIVSDMPFMSYHSDLNDAINNAGRFIKEAGVSAVKIEGASEHTLLVIKRCVEAGIPVMGHLGFTPQFLHTIGGYNVQGKNLESTQKILEDAKKLQDVGVFSIVLEMVPEESARFITENINVPTIGIGAGRYCSGQVLVTDDLIGKYADFTPKFAKKYGDIASVIKNAVINYKNDVISETFPSENEIFSLNEQEREKLSNAKH